MTNYPAAKRQRWHVSPYGAQAHPHRIYAAAPASPLSQPAKPMHPASVGLALSLAACVVLALAAYWGG